MPDFDTRRPQQQDEPSKLRLGLVANKLRSALIANRLRALLIGGGILYFVMVVYTGGLIAYQSGIGDQWRAEWWAEWQAEWQAATSQETVTCNREYLQQAGACIPPGGGGGSVSCDAKSRGSVERQGYCKRGATDEPYLLGVTVTCDAYAESEWCYPPTGEPYYVCAADARHLVDEDTYCRVYPY